MTGINGQDGRGALAWRQLGSLVCYRRPKPRQSVAHGDLGCGRRNMSLAPKIRRGRRSSDLEHQLLVADAKETILASLIGTVGHIDLDAFLGEALPERLRDPSLARPSDAGSSLNSDGDFPGISMCVGPHAGRVLNLDAHIAGLGI